MYTVLLRDFSELRKLNRASGRHVQLLDTQLEVCTGSGLTCLGLHLPVLLAKENSTERFAWVLKTAAQQHCANCASRMGVNVNVLNCLQEWANEKGIKLAPAQPVKQHTQPAKQEEQHRHILQVRAYVQACVCFGHLDDPFLTFSLLWL